MAYINICWKCREAVTSYGNEQCPCCGWFICSHCGACKKDGCRIGRFTRRDRNMLRRLRITMPLDDAIEAVEAFIKQEKEEQRRAEAERKHAEWLEKQVYVEQLRAEVMKTGSVHSSAYKESGTVLFSCFSFLRMIL